MGSGRGGDTPLPCVTLISQISACVKGVSSIDGPWMGLKEA